MAGGRAVLASRCCPHQMTCRRDIRAERWPRAGPLCGGGLATGQGLGVCRRGGGSCWGGLRAEHVPSIRANPGKVSKYITLRRDFNGPHIEGVLCALQY